MNLIQTPGLSDLFGINPRYIGIQTEDPGEDNQRIEIIVEERQGVNFEEVIRLEPELINDEAWVNISKLILLAPELPITNMINGQEFLTCSLNIKEYRVEINEYFGSEPNTLQHTTNFTGYAIRGGVAVIRNRTYDFYQDYSISHRFLTNQPREKLVNRQQPEFLYLPTFSNHYHSLKVKLFMSDGSVTDASFVPIGENHNFNSLSGEIWKFSAGFDQLSLENYENGDLFILKYELRISYHNSDGGAEVATSETMTYLIDYDERDWEERYFLFENSLGGMDVLATRGKGEQTIRLTKVSQRIAESRTSPIHEHTITDTSIRSQVRLKVNTGWINRPDREWLEDLGLSRKVWQIDLDNRQFIPVRISSTRMKIHEDDKTLQSIDFEVTYPENEAL